MNPAPRIITFYSYKGGVGRSMALLNVAYTLQSLGRHVLVIDLDLEAPGVSGFLTRNQELEPHPADQPDVVDFLKAALPVARWRPGSTDRPIIPKLSDYLRSVKPDCFAPAQNPRFERTRIDVITASDAQDYANRLADLNVAGFSSEDLEELGNVVRDLIGRHEFPFTRLKDEPPVPTKYDYVLVDSRTGFTETSGLCIGPLSDRLVVFTGLNDQNINGTAEFLRVVGLKAAARSEPWDDQDDIKDTTRYAARIGPKPTFLVASPVPHGDMELKKSRFQAIKDTIGTAPNFFITYHPRLSLFETIFLRDFPEEGITSEYRELTNAILRMVMDDASHLRSLVFPSAQLTTISHLGEPVHEPEIDSILRFAALLGEEQCGELTARLLFEAERDSRWASNQPPHRAEQAFQKAYFRYKALLLLNPEDYKAFNNWGLTLSLQANTNTLTADKAFSEAYGKFENALRIKPDYHIAFNNWGVALADQAKQKTGEHSVELLRQACSRYESALRINPAHFESLNNLGIALALLANTKSGVEADLLFDRSVQMFQKAHHLSPGSPEILIGWGAAFVARAGRSAGKDAETILESACEKYRSALKIDPKSASALVKLADAICAIAKQKPEIEADSLLADACEKYRMVLHLSPNDPVALNNLGVTFVERGRLKSGPESAALLAAAEEKYRAALAIKPDAVDVRYNLGCLQGMRGDAVGAVAWLRKAAEGGYEVTRAKLAEDRDFERVRDAAEFREFVAGLSR